MFEIDKNILKYSDLEKKEILKNYVFNNEKIKLDKNVEIKKCRFDGIIFDEVNVRFGSIEDVEFVNSDLSNFTFVDTYISKVKFKNCKLFGMHFIDSTFDNINIEECMCNIINFTNVRINNSRICESSFKSSNIDNCEFKKITLEKVDFSNSEFRDTSLKNIDLSSCNIEKINIDLKNIKGAIINLEQTMDLIGLLGVKIKE